MKLYKWMAFALVLALLFSAGPVQRSSAAPASQGTGGPYVRNLVSRGVAHMPPSSVGVPGLAFPEIRGEPEADTPTQGLRQGGARPGLNGLVNRSNSTRPDAASAGAALRQAADSLQIPVVDSTPVGSGQPGLDTNFEGLNHFDQRTANGGNQFSLEPPDQGLCVGNRKVMETVNTVMQVYDLNGNPVTGVIDLNSFFGYPAAINRTTGEQGPFVTDPNCYYDPEHGRWYLTVLTLDVDPATGDFLGTNHLDLAVSQTDDPTGDWNLYSIPAQNNGDDGTPNHNCEGGFCLGDYPQIGADRYGFYISTNEYALFGNQYTTAQIYAMSKAELAAGVANPKVVHFDNLFVAGTPGFTVWPALSPAGHYFTQAGGAEFFLSSMAAEEAGNTTGMSNRLGVWAIFNTQSLDTARPNLTLLNASIKVETYGVPPKSDQKSGPFPLGQCINDTGIVTPFGPGCWQFFFLEEPAHDEVISHLDSNDSRIQRTWYVDGYLMGALDTVVKVGGQVRAGIAYFVLGSGEVSATGGMNAMIPLMQGYLATRRNNVNYPAIAVLPSGKGVMTFTLVGQNYYPSAAYTPFDVNRGTGTIYVGKAGRAPDDGFTSYKAFVGDPPRTRWGDYSAAVTDGNRIWIATEYIQSRCNLTQYLNTNFTCGNTRTALANWSTRVMEYHP